MAEPQKVGTASQPNDIDQSWKRHGSSPDFNNRKRQRNTFESRGGRSRRQHHRQNQHNRHRRKWSATTTTTTDSSTGAPSRKHETSTCSVCNGCPNPKYKCPKCRALYCSVACCRKHKEKLCSTTAAASREGTKESRGDTVGPKSKFLDLNESVQTLPGLASNRKKENHNDSFNDEEDPEFQITSEMKDRMHASSWLQQELQDVGLRQLIQQIVNASPQVIKHRLQKTNNRATTLTHQQLLLRHLQSNHAPFGQFVDKLLVVSGILERQRPENSGRDGETTTITPRHTPKSAEDWLRDNDPNYLNESLLVLKPPPQQRRAVEHESQCSSSNSSSASSSSEEDSSSSDSDSY